MAYILYIRYILYIKYSNIYIAIATVAIAACVYICPQGPPCEKGVRPIYSHRGKRAPLALRRPPPLPAHASRPQGRIGAKKRPRFRGTLCLGSPPNQPKRAENAAKIRPPSATHRKRAVAIKSPFFNLHPLSRQFQPPVC